MVVLPLPVCQRSLSIEARGEVVSTPEFFFVDTMASFDFPILLRAPRLDVFVPDAGGFHGQLKGQRELRAIVALQLADDEGQMATKFSKEMQAGVLILTGIQT